MTQTPTVETHGPKPVVVGFDATTDAQRALAWAAEYAERSEQPLRVVVARGDLYTLSRWADEWTRGLAQEWCDQARKQLDDLGVGEAVRIDVLDGMPAQALTAASKDAAMVVVGSSGHTAVFDVLRGSVSQHVARHAQCPVAVIRAAQRAGASTVVVGVDGTGPSIDALAYAVELGVREQRPLHVVYSPERWQGYGGRRTVELPDELLAELESHEREVRAQIAEACREAGVSLELQEVQENPAHAIVEASRAAALVVVGSRGRGAFAGLSLGSVSSDVVRHAHCPVIVMRETQGGGVSP